MGLRHPEDRAATNDGFLIRRAELAHVRTQISEPLLASPKALPQAGTLIASDLRTLPRYISNAFGHLKRGSEA